MIETNEQAAARLGLRRLTPTQLVIFRTARDIYQVSLESEFLCSVLSMACRANIANSEHAEREYRELEQAVKLALHDGDEPQGTLAIFAAYGIQKATGSAYHDAWESVIPFLREMRMAWVDRIIEMEAI